MAITLDLGTRKAAGWSMDDTMTEKLVSDALTMALGCVAMKPGAIHHSDRGSQYASYSFQTLLEANELTPSMSRKGNCWDNAPTESFFHSLKTKLIYFEITKPERRLRRAFLNISKYSTIAKGCIRRSTTKHRLTTNRILINVHKSESIFFR